MIVAELPLAEDVVLRIHQDSTQRSVSMVPDQPAAKWEFSGGVLTVGEPRVAIHSVVAVD